MKEIRVRELILEGSSKVGKYGIVGRGCVSIVVRARLESLDDLVALKIRRVDADREDMKRDFELQTFANSLGVGPRALACSADLFAMELVDGVRMGVWFRNLRTRSPKRHTRMIIRSALEQCYLLDLNRLDHGELSNPTKHILIRSDTNQAVIIDYESASRERRVSNLTSVSQFLLMSSPQSKKLRTILGFARFSEGRFISLLREYKSKPNAETLEKIFDFMRV
jgi:putative serine/threonine protein kinase